MSVAEVSDALGVGEALGVVLVEAVGVGNAFSSELELFPFAQTIKPRRIIPTATAKMTRPDAPGFFSAVDTTAPEEEGTVGIITGAGAGVETISTRALRGAGIGASGITIVSAPFFEAILFVAFFAMAFLGALDVAFFGAAFFFVVFFTALFLTAVLLTTDFLDALDVAFFGADFLTVFFAAALLATDFLAVAFFTATVTPQVAVRTIGNAHL